MSVQVGLLICDDCILAAVSGDNTRDPRSEDVCLYFQKSDSGKLFPDDFPRQLADTVAKLYRTDIDVLMVAATFPDYETRLKLDRAFLKPKICSEMRLISTAAAVMCKKALSISTHSFLFVLDGDPSCPSYGLGECEGGVLELLTQGSCASESISMSDLISGVLNENYSIMKGKKFYFFYDDRIYPENMIREIISQNNSLPFRITGDMLSGISKMDAVSGVLSYAKRRAGKLPDSPLLLYALTHRISLRTKYRTCLLLTQDSTIPLRKEVVMEMPWTDPKHGGDPGGLSLLVSVEGRPDEELEIPLPVGDFFLKELSNQKKREPITFHACIDVDYDETLTVTLCGDVTGTTLQLSENDFGTRLIRTRTKAGSSSSPSRGKAAAGPLKETPAPSKSSNSSNSSNSSDPSDPKKKHDVSDSSEEEENEKLIQRFIDLVDSTDYGIRMLSDEDLTSSAGAGLLAINKTMLNILAGLGIEPYTCIDQPFDALIHEAFEHVVSPEYPKNWVIGEIRKGYLWNGKILRYNRVKVAN